MKLSKNLFLSIVLFTFSLGNASAFTNGVGSGGGGDARCLEFYRLASDISITLAKLGQSNINNVDSLINVGLVRQLVMKPLNVTPAHNLPRQAISYPDSDSTQLDVEQWDTLDEANKIKLVTHELMVLSRVEGDGEYAVSKDAEKILSDNGFKELKYESLGDHTVNPDGSVTIQFPQAFGLHIMGSWNPYTNDTSSKNGVCRYFGFRTAVAASQSNCTTWGYVKIDDQGHQSGISLPSKEIDQQGIFTSITCVN